MCSGGRWTQITARRSNRRHRTTAGRGCWTSWTWPSLTSSWVSQHVSRGLTTDPNCEFPLVLNNVYIYMYICNIYAVCNICCFTYILIQETWTATIMRRLKSLEMRLSSSTWTTAEGASQTVMWFVFTSSAAFLLLLLRLALVYFQIHIDEKERITNRDDVQYLIEQRISWINACDCCVHWCWL